MMPPESARRGAPDPRSVLASLVDLAGRTGIRVRFDELSRDPAMGERATRGGLCVLRGDPLVVLDVRDTPHAQAQVLAGALARFGVYSIFGPHPPHRVGT
jgi:hypothetical protein